MDRPSQDTTVVLVEWPRETEVAERLRLARRPRLLLLSPDAVPPLSADELQDWVRVPSDPIEVRARVKALELRAQRLRTPTLDENGRVTVGDKWVALPPIEARLMQAFVDAFATMVPRTELAERAWPDGGGTSNQLDVRLRSLRRRLRPLRLQITAVRGRGFTLQWTR
jgi:DNA-binding response OmpR family regulator